MTFRKHKSGKTAKPEDSAVAEEDRSVFRNATDHPIQIHHINDASVTMVLKEEKLEKGKSGKNKKLCSITSDWLNTSSV